MKKFFVYTLLFLITLILGISGYMYHQYTQFLMHPVFKQLPVTLEIKKGTSYGEFIEIVKSHQGNGSVLNWKIMGRFNDLHNSIKTGEFEFTELMAPRQVIQQIEQNKVKTYSITLVEGHSWNQIKTQLLMSPIKHILSDVTDEQLIDMLGINATHLEGQFLPETYQYVKGDKDIDLLKRAHQALKEELNQTWANRDQSILLKNPYELLILASIIEKETAQNSERNIISGVFHRRLQKGMKLQTDPTVIYGVGKAYAGDITSAHLVTDTPYNTYTRRGLPPTPIAMPSALSIEAAAHPNDGNELYFVADNKGGHRFSETYEQHQAAVKAYLRGN